MKSNAKQVEVKADKKQLLEIAGAYKMRKGLEKCLLTINSDWLL